MSKKSNQRGANGSEACAAATPPRPNGAEHSASQEAHATPNKDKKKKQIPPGKRPLSVDAAEFVDGVHRKIDLTEVWHDLLRSEDEKIKQRAIEKLTAMLYEDGAISSDDAEQIIFDLPRPRRD